VSSCVGYDRQSRTAPREKRRCLQSLRTGGASQKARPTASARHEFGRHGRKLLNFTLPCFYILVQCPAIKFLSQKSGKAKMFKCSFQLVQSRQHSRGAASSCAARSSSTSLLAVSHAQTTRPAPPRAESLAHAAASRVPGSRAAIWFSQRQEWFGRVGAPGCQLGVRRVFRAVLVLLQGPRAFGRCTCHPVAVSAGGDGLSPRNS